MHAHAVARVERRVGDVARERDGESRPCSPLRSQRPRAQSRTIASSSICDGELDDVGHAERAAGDREPVDDGVLLRGQLADAVAEELLERRGQPPNPASPRSVRTSTELRSPLSVSVSRISSAPRSRSASTISRRKNGLPPTFGKSSAQTCRAPSRTPRRVSTRRTCSSGMRPRSSTRITPSRALSTRSSGRVTRRTRIGSGSAPCAISPMTSRLGLVAPVHALDDEHERLAQRDRRQQVPQPGDDVLLARVRVLVAAAELAGRELGEARDHRVRRIAAGGRAARASDERRHLVEELLAGRPDGPAHEVRDRRVRDLHRDGRALDVKEPRVRRQLGEERGDERGLADAHLADDRAADELPRTPAAAADRLVERGVEVRLLGVAPDEIARRRPAPRRGAPRARGSARARRRASSAALRGWARTRGAASARRPSGSRAARAGRRRRRPTCAPGASPARGRRRGTPSGRAASTARGARARPACRSRCRARCRSTRRPARARSSLKPAIVSWTSSASCAASAAARDELAATPAMAWAVGVAGPHPAHPALEGEVVEHPADLVEHAARQGERGEALRAAA